MPITQLSSSGMPGRRFGSFAGKTAASALEPMCLHFTPVAVRALSVTPAKVRTLTVTPVAIRSITIEPEEC